MHYRVQTAKEHYCVRKSTAAQTALDEYIRTKAREILKLKSDIELLERLFEKQRRAKRRGLAKTIKGRRDRDPIVKKRLQSLSNRLRDSKALHNQKLKAAASVQHKAYNQLGRTQAALRGAGRKNDEIDRLKANAKRKDDKIARLEANKNRKDVEQRVLQRNLNTDNREANKLQRNLQRNGVEQGVLKQSLETANRDAANQLQRTLAQQAKNMNRKGV
eukprot:6173505-Pleurochrysis_carterae.AAC.1